MSQHTIEVTDLVIPSASQESNELTATTDFRDAESLMIYGPATLPETVKVRIQAPGDTAWKLLQMEGADVAIGAGDAVAIYPVNFNKLELYASSGAVAADRTFKVSKNVWV